ncbi:unnamed protein product [Prunus armeniaca]
MQTSEGNWRKGKLANHLGRKIRQVAWEILIGHQYTTHMYCKHFKATGKGESVQPPVQTKQAGG